ncbi:hypothetical protein [Sphingosinithalassobacter sp. CS137]|uniref:hypothetical protein n=1 Tax=Sphingosinithalassobacter sp. CS137 TaxID=2762748 RepID=UPI00165E41FA|nr:hypothetical protein [Sphingosinithalassobacter sp. CS137]
MNIPIAPLAAAFLGLASAAGFALMPTPVLESTVIDSGIAAIVAAAEPPLGMTARLLVAAGAGILVALVTWFALFLLLGGRAIVIGKRVERNDAAPVVRRADAHPDAPPRPPLRATRDLGPPFLEVHARLRRGDEPLTDGEAEEVFETELVLSEPLPDAAVADDPEQTPPTPAEAELPQDLNQPLSAFDPGAIRESPMPAPSSVLPLKRSALPPRPPVFTPSERFETFELTPPVRNVAPPPPAPAPISQEAPITRPETEATVHALLDRLEKGVVRRGLASGVEQPQRDPEHGLQEALVTLRNLARRA